MLIGFRIMLAAIAMVGALPLLLKCNSPKPFVAGLIVAGCTAAAGAMTLSLAA